MWSDLWPLVGQGAEAGGTHWLSTLSWVSRQPVFARGALSKAKQIERGSRTPRGYTGTPALTLLRRGRGAYPHAVALPWCMGTCMDMPSHVCTYWRPLGTWEATGALWPLGALSWGEAAMRPRGTCPPALKPQPLPPALQSPTLPQPPSSSDPPTCPRPSQTPPTPHPAAPSDPTSSPKAFYPVPAPQIPSASPGAPQGERPPSLYSQPCSPPATPHSPSPLQCQEPHRGQILPVGRGAG